jgi:hypothetical protein
VLLYFLTVIPTTARPYQQPPMTPMSQRSGEEEPVLQPTSANHLSSNVDTFELKKSDMVSGEYALLLLGNNADGPAFAYQRNIYITAGPQVTLTVRP